MRLRQEGLRLVVWGAAVVVVAAEADERISKLNTGLNLTCGVM